MPVAGDEEIATAAQHLIATHKINAVLATRSADGMTLVQDGGKVRHFPAQAQEVFDVSGAGDTVAATLGTALAAGLGEDQAVQLANDTEFGLAAYFYSRDIGRIWRVAEQLEYGIVGINAGIISTEVAPFGGMKESGVGREGSHFGLDEFMEVKYLCMGGIDS